MTDTPTERSPLPGPETADQAGAEGAGAAADDRPEGRSRARDFRAKVLPPILVFLGSIGLWYIAAAALGETTRKTALAYPHRVLAAFTGGATGEQPGQLLSATWLTFIVAIAGLLIAMVLGIIFAVLMSQAQWVETSFYPYAVLLQTVPILALVPLIGLIFGFGMGARILVCVIISLFPIITNTLFGLKSAEQAQHELFTLHRAGRMTRLMKLQFPAALPAMFTGFQISAGLSVIGAIVGGFFFGRGPKDLGNRILLYSNRLRPAEMIAAVILSALLGVIFFQFFGWAGNRLTRSWYKGEK